LRRLPPFNGYFQLFVLTADSNAGQHTAIALRLEIFDVVPRFTTGVELACKFGTRRRDR
jgi:hypothetical protein